MSSDSAFTKYEPGQSARRSGSLPLSPLELATVVHAAVLAIAATWDFGGNDLRLRLPLLAWGSLSLGITLLALRTPRDGHRRPSRKRYLWLVPAILFNLYVAIGIFNPSQIELFDGVHQVLVTGTYVHWLPSTAVPEAAGHALWLFDCAYLTAFNLAIVIRQRRALRALLLVLGANAVILAVFGTLQKLAGAKGLYFGLVHSTNPTFFATFIYHNHWGAYVLLSTSAALGLFWHFFRRGEREYRDIWHSPVLLGGVAILLLAATIPLCSSRSSTLLLIALLGFVALHAGIRAIRSRRSHNESAALPLIGIGVILAIACGAVFWLGQPVIKARWTLTKSQVAQMEQEGSIGSRLALYRDTIAMGRDQPVFGWGMGSYPTIFYRYNSAQPRSDLLPIFYEDAHSDWLQAFAELGFVGSSLIGLCALLPAFTLVRTRVQSLLSRYLVIGCGLILAYAWVEFPFGNFAVVIVWWLNFFAAVSYASLN